jgi:hypothetical protein
MSEIIRALDLNGDWTFGQGINNYKRNQDALAQDIGSNLASFLNDCFFDTTSGIDWWNLIGSKDQTGLNLAISTTILNTVGVTGINQVSVSLDNSRHFSVSYKVQSIYGVLSNIYQYSLNPIG